MTDLRKPTRSFASDNNATIHTEILAAISRCNEGHVVGYGDDPYTESAIKKFKEVFGKTCEVFFVFNGTAANTLSFKSLTKSFNSIICAQTAHANTDECGAPEENTGCKLQPILTKDGKLTVEKIQELCRDLGDQHHVQPKVVTITQTTEMGTTYQPDEIKKIAKFTHQNNMYLHMDGARISNAAAHLKTSLKKITNNAGVDVLSFGGTKNGLLGGEAVVFFDRELAKDFKFIRKQKMQLSSKMRFVSCQFGALLTDDLWRQNAEHANSMAKLLAKNLHGISQIQITQKVEGNAIFAVVPKTLIPKLQKKYFFYVWNELANEVRWMASHDTTEEDVIDFVETIKLML